MTEHHDLTGRVASQLETGEAGDDAARLEALERISDELASELDRAAFAAAPATHVDQALSS